MRLPMCREDLEYLYRTALNRQRNFRKYTGTYAVKASRQFPSKAPVPLPSDLHFINLRIDGNLFFSSNGRNIGKDTN